MDDVSEQRQHIEKDISAMTSPDMAAVQQKLFAGAGMKTAIKRFLDVWDGPGITSRTINRRAKEMREAMEKWCNLEPA